MHMNIMTMFLCLMSVGMNIMSVLLCLMGMGMMIISVPMVMMNMHLLPLTFHTAHRSAAHRLYRNLPAAFLRIPLAPRPEGTALGHIFYIGLNSREGLEPVLGHGPPQSLRIGMAQGFL